MKHGRFMVVHPGARMHYAVPAILARAGMLDSIWTDVCANVGLCRWLALIWPKRLRPAAVRRMLGRRVPSDVPRETIHASLFWTRVEAVEQRLIRADRHTDMQPPGYFSLDARLRRHIDRHGFGRANALYVFSCQSTRVIAAAKEHGLYVVYEVPVAPEVWRVVQEEQIRFPGIESGMAKEKIESVNKWFLSEARLADLIVVPSDFVLESAVESGLPRERIAVVPYGVSENWLREKPKPERGRVLFVGSVGLRKGVHYLASAAKIVRSKGESFEVRAVGPYDPRVIQRPEFSGLHYVGPISRDEVQAELLSADFFVLPSLAEGSATVSYEALACGLPVIATPSSGTVVRDGVEGFIVPPRNADALADRMERLLCDRDLRERMSRNARERAREYTWGRYGERLLAAFSVA